MSKYKILEPVVFLQGGKVFHFKSPTDLVRLDDDVAKKLGDVVESREPQEDSPKTSTKSGSSKAAEKQ